MKWFLHDDGCGAGDYVVVVVVVVVELVVKNNKKNWSMVSFNVRLN